jgi:hypothetical protein
MDHTEWPAWLVKAMSLDPRLQRMSDAQLRNLVAELEDAVESGACFRPSGIFPAAKERDDVRQGRLADVESWLAGDG